MWPTSLSSEASAGAGSAWGASPLLSAACDGSGSGLRPRLARRALALSSSRRRISGMRSSAAFSAAALSAAYAAAILAACTRNSAVLRWLPHNNQHSPVTLANAMFRSLSTSTTPCHARTILRRPLYIE